MVTRLLMAACCLVYVGELASPQLLLTLALTPTAVQEGELYRFLTSMFAHSPNPLHIIFNMAALWMVGRALEEGVGSLRYLGLYLACGLAGGLAYLAYLASSPTLPAVGASGAIFGLLGAALPLTRFNSRVVATVLLNVVIGFTVPGIAWQAHLGGLALGLLLGLLLARSTSHRLGVGRAPEASPPSPPSPAPPGARSPKGPAGSFKQGWRARSRER